jgi:hypothetical protein
MGVEKIYVVGIKSQGVSGSVLLSRHGRTDGIESFSAARKMKSSWARNKEIRSVIDGFEFIDIMSVICPSDDFCQVLTPNGKVIFYDRQHLSPAGAKHLGKELRVSGALPFLTSK